MSGSHLMGFKHKYKQMPTFIALLPHDARLIAIVITVKSNFFLRELLLDDGAFYKFFFFILGEKL